MLNQSHQKAVHEIANKVDQLILDTTARAPFIEHIGRLCEMVEDYGQAQQPYTKKLEETRKRIEKDKNSRQFCGRCLTDICPPPEGYVKIHFSDNGFINVPMGTIYRPVEPANPLLWFGIFGNASVQRKPQDNEKLMCAYVLLTIIHDYELRYSGTPTDTYISSSDYEAKWFQRDDFFKNVWSYYHYDAQSPNLHFRPATANERLSQLNRAFDRVYRDLATKLKKEAEKLAGTEQKASLGTSQKILNRAKRIPRWIYYVLVCFAALLTVLHLLGSLEPIKDFVSKMLWPK